MLYLLTHIEGLKYMVLQIYSKVKAWNFGWFCGCIFIITTFNFNDTDFVGMHFLVHLNFFGLKKKNSCAVVFHFCFCPTIFGNCLWLFSGVSLSAINFPFRGKLKRQYTDFVCLKTIFFFFSQSVDNHVSSWSALV